MIAMLASPGSRGRVTTPEVKNNNGPQLGSFNHVLKGVNVRLGLLRADF